MSDKQLYRLHRNMYTGDLFGNWIGTNNDGMNSDDGMFEFVFVPVKPCEHGNFAQHIFECGGGRHQASHPLHYEWCEGADIGGDI